MSSSSSKVQDSRETSAAEPEASPRAGIVWLASYPKSGNTWTRAFLHNLMMAMSGEEGPQNINALNRYSTGVIATAFYTEVLGFRPGKEHRNEVAAARHEVQRRVVDEFEGLVFAKTHQALVMDRGSTTINFAVTSGAAYIVRNPLDVVISYSHHIGRTIDDTIAIMAHEHAETGVTKKMVYEVYSSWSTHVRSWTRNPHPAILVMRYEDMIADPAKSFGAFARHFLLDPTPAELADAIERSSFDKLQAQEEEAGFRERPKKSKRFFREGRTGQWKETLTPAQIDRIVRDHGEEMQRFNYLPL
jgi:catechol 2,3-dioxygenase-like lactoylglutathione lyase family enzyme